MDAPTRTVVVMGTSGVGKSTIGSALASRLGWVFEEGDLLHPAANIEAMRAGRPLTDEQRIPWLRSVAAWIGEQEAAGRDAVVTCSALKRSYRAILLDGHPSVVFCDLVAPTDVVAARLARRHGHFMPASLLPTQLATLEPLGPGEPGALVPASGSVEHSVDEAIELLGLDDQPGGPVRP